MDLHVESLRKETGLLGITRRRCSCGGWRQSRVLPRRRDDSLLANSEVGSAAAPGSAEVFHQHEVGLAARGIGRRNNNETLIGGNREAKEGQIG